MYLIPETVYPGFTGPFGIYIGFPGLAEVAVFRAIGISFGITEIFQGFIRVIDKLFGGIGILRNCSMLLPAERDFSSTDRKGIKIECGCTGGRSVYPLMLYHAFLVDLCTGTECRCCSENREEE